MHPAPARGAHSARPARARVRAAWRPGVIGRASRSPHEHHDSDSLRRQPVARPQPGSAVATRPGSGFEHSPCARRRFGARRPRWPPAHPASLHGAAATGCTSVESASRGRSPNLDLRPPGRDQSLRRWPAVRGSGSCLRIGTCPRLRTGGPGHRSGPGTCRCRTAPRRVGQPTGGFASFGHFPARQSRQRRSRIPRMAAGCRRWRRRWWWVGRRTPADFAPLEEGGVRALTSARRPPRSSHRWTRRRAVPFPRGSDSAPAGPIRLRLAPVRFSRTSSGIAILVRGRARCAVTTHLVSSHVGDSCWRTTRIAL
jgi:hypothetical protein